MLYIAIAIVSVISLQNILETSSFLSRHSILKSTLIQRLHAIRPPDWKDDSTNRETNIKLNQDLVHVMDLELGSIVSNLSIDTVTYYMLEFRNDVLQRWMMSFANYSTSGFPNNDWTQYLERMIKTSDEKIQVIMKPPQNIIRGNMGANMAIQYDFDVGKFKY